MHCGSLGHIRKLRIKMQLLVYVRFLDQLGQPIIEGHSELTCIARYAQSRPVCGGNEYETTRPKHPKHLLQTLRRRLDMFQDILKKDHILRVILKWKTLRRSLHHSATVSEKSACRIDKERNGLHTRGRKPF